MKFKTELLKELMDLSLNQQCTFENKVHKIVYIGDWISEGKYENQETVFRVDDKFYMINESRSGSYFSEWHYDSSDWEEVVECDEVKPIEKTIIVWEKI